MRNAQKTGWRQWLQAIFSIFHFTQPLYATSVSLKTWTLRKSTYKSSLERRSPSCQSARVCHNQVLDLSRQKQDQRPQCGKQVECKSTCIKAEKKAVSLAFWKCRKTTDFKKGSLQWLRVVGRRKETITIVGKKSKRNFALNTAVLKEFGNLS